MSTAATRSAVPVAWVTSVCTANPLRFSINTCPRWFSLASFPGPLRYRRASGSVVD